MADIRIKDLGTTASVTASDDFMAVDGTTNGTRKMNAAAPAFLTSVTTPSLTSPASTNLTLGTTDSGAAITVLAASNNVGVGVIAPAYLLELQRTLAGSASAVTSMLSLNALGSGNTVKIRLTDNVTSDAYITHTGAGAAANQLLGFGINGVQAVVLNGSGNFLIGTTDATGLTGAGGLKIASTTAGSSGAGALVLQGGISAGNTGSAASYFGGAVSVGTGAAVGGATAGAGGLAFPAIDVAVANANTLDDYEEGTWTPAFASTAATFAYAEQFGSYVKVGSLVTLQMRLRTSSVIGTTTNTAAITGLPFASANLNANSTSAGAVGLCNVTGGLAMSIDNNEGTYLTLWNFATITQPIASSLDGKYFNATISYRTA